jgi:CheY-like chemotaxis protein/curved DNA-binding protein CbpA
VHPKGHGHCVVKYRVLIVDDEESIRDLLTTFLLKQGFLVTAVPDGSGLFKSIEVERPDIFVLDYLLPKQNGLQLLERLRKDPRFSTTPAIMMSGVLRNTKTMIEARESCGAYAFLSKPLRLEDLSSTLRQALGASNQPSPEGPGVESQNQEMPDLPSEGSVLDEPVPWVLTQLRRLSSTGMLDLHDGDIRRRIYVIDGRPRFLQSNAPGEDVGALLQERGRITAVDYKRCTDFAAEKQSTMQRALLELRMVSENELSAAYKIMAGRALPRAMGIARGTYRFRDTDAFLGRIPEGRFDDLSCLFEGIRNFVRPPQVLRFFRGKMNTEVSPSSDYKTLIPYFDRAFPRSEVIGRFHATPSCGRIIGTTANSAEWALELFCLLTTGILILSRKPADIDGVSDAVHLAISSLEDERTGHELARPVTEHEAKAFLEGVKSSDFYGVFSVSPSSELKEIKASYYDLCRKWEGRKFQSIQAKEDCVAALDAVAQAYETLADDALRKKYNVFRLREQNGLASEPQEIERGEQFYAQARAMMSRGEWASARQALEYAVSRNSEPLYAATLAWVAFQCDPTSAANIETSKSQILAALGVNSELPSAYEFLGSIAAYQGRQAEAVKWWDACLARTPENETARRGLMKLKRLTDSQPPPSEQAPKVGSFLKRLVSKPK